MIIQWFKSFLALNDKAQAIRAEEVAVYIDEKKETYIVDMIKLQKQARIVHNRTKRAHVESIKLNKMVDGITSKIAIATGGTTLRKK